MIDSAATNVCSVSDLLHKNKLDDGQIRKNPKIDWKIIAEFDDLLSKMPENMRPKQGADYGIAHPFERQPAILNRSEKDVR